jgi:hypothetical protein
MGSQSCNLCAKELYKMKTGLLGLVAALASLPALADELVSTSAAGVAVVSTSAVTTIPAPAAIALFGAGVAGLLIARRLRKR